MENEKNVKKENNNKISILIWNFQQAEHFGEFTRLSPVIYGVVSGDPPHPPRLNYIPARGWGN